MIISMKRILIIGCPGSGKSYFAKRLGEITKLPVIHMDNIYWKKDKTSISKEELMKKLQPYLEKDEWIIDGSYFNRVPERFMLADYIIIMNFNRFSATHRILKRTRKYKGIQRDDMAEGCKDRFNLSFICWSMFGSRSKKRRNQIKHIERTYPEKIIMLFSS